MTTQTPLFKFVCETDSAIAMDDPMKKKKWMKNIKFPFKKNWKLKLGRKKFCCKFCFSFLLNVFVSSKANSKCPEYIIDFSTTTKICQNIQNGSIIFIFNKTITNCKRQKGNKHLIRKFHIRVLQMLHKKEHSEWMNE